ncbi:uncharacterized protein LOC143352820 [Halictus rubicundus]|uniref:uncharacterized protein LOC143352820 n=1 Tax=Halictus rubicundus TaxID=77578 RepID=UPI004035F90C
MLEIIAFETEFSNSIGCVSRSVKTPRYDRLFVPTQRGAIVPRLASPARQDDKWENERSLRVTIFPCTVIILGFPAVLFGLFKPTGSNEKVANLNFKLSEPWFVILYSL